jgi:beta-glucosidase
MRAKNIVYVGVILLLAICVVRAQEAQPDYKNPALPIEHRVADLLKRMTLDEKVDQLRGGHRYHVLDDTGTLTQEQGEALLHKMWENNFEIPPRRRAVLDNGIQRYEMEKSRLGIPALLQGEALHGFMSFGSTSFPIPLALGSSWDPKLVEEVFTAASDEMSAAGINQAFTPVIDLARDPRWGRTEETYGEDPYLVARMGVAAIEGLQGHEFLIDRHHVMATAKHFVHGQMEGGRNTGPSNISERILRESFLVPFEAAVKEAHTGSVMASYNEIDGIPVHINHWILGDVLRGEWKFDGFITSDGNALQMLYETHHVAADKADAARQSLAAGVDYDLSDGSVFATLSDQVKSGKVPQGELDTAAARILAAKFRLGLFDHPYVDVDYAEKTTNSAVHKTLALKAAEESIVLLKNDASLLPLDPAKMKTIAVIGPNATDVHQGGYSRGVGPGNGISLLDGIKKRAESAGAKVLYAEGCDITKGPHGWAEWYANDVKLGDPAAQSAKIAAAVEVAKKSDVAIVVVGENEGTNREAWSENHVGDRDSLDLLGAQDDLIRAIVATGKPVVVFLLNGRPLSISYAAAHVPAILEGWYLGEAGGTAAAEALFGDVNPGGKLPVTFPRSVGQLPDYYDHKPSRNRSYAFADSTPLFPFGFGLSYTKFSFANLRVDSASIPPSGSAAVSVDVTNTGSREGVEVVQLYVHERVTPVTVPVMELRAFERVALQPGEKKTVHFQLGPDQLSLIDTTMHRVVVPGTFDILVGPSSAETQKLALEVK